MFGEIITLRTVNNNIAIKIEYLVFRDPPHNIKKTTQYRQYVIFQLHLDNILRDVFSVHLLCLLVWLNIVSIMSPLKETRYVFSTHHFSRRVCVVVVIRCRIMWKYRSVIRLSQLRCYFDGKHLKKSINTDRFNLCSSYPFAKSMFLLVTDGSMDICLVETQKSLYWTEARMVAF